MIRNAPMFLCKMVIYKIIINKKILNFLSIAQKKEIVGMQLRKASVYKKLLTIAQSFS